MTAQRNQKAAPSEQPKRARSSTHKIQLLIVDEHPHQRAGVRNLLESDDTVEVVGEAGTVEAALDVFRESPLDVVLMDVDEATTEAVEDMRRLRDEMNGDAALVVMSRREDDEGIYQAILGGAAGHLAEDANSEEMVDTIMEAALGHEPISKTLIDHPAVGRRVLEAYAELAGRNPVAREPELTERELSILRHAAEGMTNQQIGRSLGLSEHTIKSAISHILARLGLRHRTEAVVHAMRNGWIAGPQKTEKTAAGESDGRSLRTDF